MGFKTADSYVSQPKGAYGKSSGLQPNKARRQGYTPEYATNQPATSGKAPKVNKQPTEA